MLLQCLNISKNYNKLLFENLNLIINKKDKLFIIGPNGTGKTTLLKILTNEIYPDTGSVIHQPNITIGYLSQHFEFEKETIIEEMLNCRNDILTLEANLKNIEQRISVSKDKSEQQRLLISHQDILSSLENLGYYTYKSEITSILTGLSFTKEMFNTKINTLSGGYKTKLSLCKLLVKNPDIIILDEPTNHLDMNSINSLEQFLNSKNITLVCVSHDRYFIDKIATKIFDITDNTLYNGNYTDYIKKKKQIDDTKLKMYDKQQKEIKRQLDIINNLRSFKTEKSNKRAESRQKYLDNLKIIDKPIISQNQFNLKLSPHIISGKDVLTIKNLSISYDKPLLNNISLDIKRGEKIAIIGNNGVGKSSLIKYIINNSNNNNLKLGENVKIGYIDQEFDNLNPSETLVDSLYNYTNIQELSKIYNTLSAFLFKKEQFNQEISTLSGGEKNRLLLARLMISNVNFIILDEPTNHLDMLSKEALENAIINYTGTILYISHDRYFINKTATRILHIENNTINNYLGNYDYFLSKYKTKNESKPITKDINLSSILNSLSWKDSKEERAKNKKISNKLNSTKKSITETENELEKLNELLNTEEIATNPEKALEIHNLITNLENKLLELYDEENTLSNSLNEYLCN